MYEGIAGINKEVLSQQFELRRNAWEARMPKLSTHVNVTLLSWYTDVRRAVVGNVLDFVRSMSRVGLIQIVHSL